MTPLAPPTTPTASTPSLFRRELLPPPQNARTHWEDGSLGTHVTVESAASWSGLECILLRQDAGRGDARHGGWFVYLRSRLCPVVPASFSIVSASLLSPTTTTNTAQLSAPPPTPAPAPTHNTNQPHHHQTTMPALRICLSPGPFTTPTWSPTHRDSLKPVHQHWFTTPLRESSLSPIASRFTADQTDSPSGHSRSASVSSAASSTASSPSPTPTPPPADRWTSTPDWTALTRSVSSPL